MSQIFKEPPLVRQCSNCKFFRSWANGERGDCLVLLPPWVKGQPEHSIQRNAKPTDKCHFHVARESPPPPRDTTAEEVVDAIISDLTDRKGLKQEWEEIDEDVQEEIRERWITIVRETVNSTR